MAEEDKVVGIFRELVGDRAEKLRGDRLPAQAMTEAGDALAHGKTDEEFDAAHQVAFHMFEWQRSAAFLVAFTLFPEKFSPEEIREEIDEMLWDLPAHILEAARQGGYPAENIFKDDSKE